MIEKTVNTDGSIELSCRHIFGEGKTERDAEIDFLDKLVASHFEQYKYCEDARSLFDVNDNINDILMDFVEYLKRENVRLSIKADDV